MTERRLLVIGSQCDGKNHLAFLPEVAKRLHALMQSPGDCVGVKCAGRPDGLLIDPTVAEAKAAIKAAIEQAANAHAVLILAYIGHGEFNGPASGDFYLYPKDASSPTSDEAIHFAEYIKDRIGQRRDLPGLLVLMDACFAGAGAWQTMERWVQSQRGDFRFEFLTATDDTSTARAVLSHTIIELLERGDPEAGDRLHASDAHRLLATDNFRPQHVAFNASTAPLQLGRNIAKDPGDVFWKGTVGFVDILRWTEYFQPTEQLDRLVEASNRHSVVVLTGPAGAGKSTLAAALARPDLTGGRVPPGFVHAIAVLNLGSDESSIAADIAGQLEKSLPEFGEANDAFDRSMPRDERERMALLPRKVLGLVSYLPDGSEARIVLDGFDQLSEGTRKLIGRWFGVRPTNLRLVITTRPDTPDCPSGDQLAHGGTTRSSIADYLVARRLPDPAQRAILDRAGDHWLVAKLLADAVKAEPAIDLAGLPSTVEGAYARLLNQAGAAVAWPGRYRPTLGVLAVAGPGVSVPLALLIEASTRLGRVGDTDDLRAVLSRLRGLVVRTAPDTPDEHIGLFHPTFADYLLSGSDATSDYVINPAIIHPAIVEAIAAIAPMDEHKHNDPVHRYAFLREAEHIGVSGDFEWVMTSLGSRESPIPRENLARHQSWSERFETKLDRDNSIGLHLRSDVAHWIGDSGDARLALELYKALLPDQVKAIGPDHPDTLTTRNNVAHWTGRTGDARRALEMYKALLPDRVEASGPDHPDTLTTRANIAAWTGRTGDARGALEMYKALLPDRVKAIGPDHPDTLTTRNNIGAWTGETGDARGALELFTALLPDQEKASGADHPDTLSTRSNVAGWTGQTGDARRALELLTALLPDQEKAIGPDHPDTLTTRNNIAALTGETRDARAALGLFEVLLPDQVKAIGPDHPDTLATRHNIAAWTGETGDARRALELFTALLPDQVEVIGPDHPDTLNTMGKLGILSMRTGKSGDGCRWLREGLKRAENRFGADDPLTSTFRDLLSQFGCDKGEAGPNQSRAVMMARATDSRPR